MIEVKSEGEMQDPDIQEKKKTADKYCELVSKNVGKYGITKPWRYVIIPTEKNNCKLYDSRATDRQWLNGYNRIMIRI